MVASCRSLWHVEQSWHMSKHDLRARPVFHHQRDSIEVHLTTVMAALAVARHLQDTTGMSGLLGVSRTALKAVFQAACLTARCSSSTSPCVLYPRAEWSRF